MKTISRWIPAVLLMALSSCSYKLEDSNRRYMSDFTEMRAGAVGEGYLIARRGNVKTFRFRNLLHEEDSPRIVEITAPVDRRKSSRARMQEVEASFEPGYRTRYSLRILDAKEGFPPNRGIANSSSELIVGISSSHPRLCIGHKGEPYANHLLHTHLHKVRRNQAVASIRNLGYAATAPADLIIIPAGLFYLSVNSSIRSAF